MALTNAGLVFTFCLLLAFVVILLLLFSECLSPGYIYLVVDMAHGSVLCSLCT